MVSPYIHAHRGRTFVICFGGEALKSPHFSTFTQDIALLSSLGIRLVLVHGIRPQVEQFLHARGLQLRQVNDWPITDEHVLQGVKSAIGEVKTEIESSLSRGLANTPTTSVPIYTVSGNFITARPLGVREGIDYCYTGEVRRVDALALTHYLDEGCILLISPVGYSPSGEVFYLNTEEVASTVAIALRAAKWICLTENEGLMDAQGQLVRQLTVIEAQRWLAHCQPDLMTYLQLVQAIHACQRGVQRVHLVSRQIEGALLLELFTRDGIGTLISTDPFEHVRKATLNDIGGLLELIKPLEEKGILVRRSREKLEMEIDYFTIQERDGMIIACAALYPFAETKMAELACLAVHSHYRGENRGEALLAFLEREAKHGGLSQLFVFTTHTAHWFQERGFVAAGLETLPLTRRVLYNYQRQSKLFIKQLV